MKTVTDQHNNKSFKGLSPPSIPLSHPLIFKITQDLKSNLCAQLPWRMWLGAIIFCMRELMDSRKISTCWWLLLSTKTADVPSRSDGDGMTAGLYLEINGRGAISSEMIVIKEHSSQVQTRCLQTPVIFVSAAGMRCCSSKNGSSIRFLEVIISRTLLLQEMSMIWNKVWLRKPLISQNLFDLCTSLLSSGYTTC